MLAPRNTPSKNRKRYVSEILENAKKLVKSTQEDIVLRVHAVKVAHSFEKAQ